MTDQENLQRLQTAFDRLFAREQVNSLILLHLLSGELIEKKYEALREQTLATMLASSAPDAVIDAALSQFDFYSKAVASHAARMSLPNPPAGGA